MVTMAQDSDVVRYKLSTRVGEAFVGEGPELAHIDISIGQRGTPFETAFITALATPKIGHTALLAILAPNFMVRPATLMVNKVTIKDEEHANLMFGPAQAAVARAVLDSVQDDVISVKVADEILIIASIYLHGNAKNKGRIYTNNYEAMKLAIRNAMEETPTIAELIAKKDTIKHPLM